MPLEEDRSPLLTFKKEERLKSKLLFEKLLAANQSLFSYPFKCYYLYLPTANAGEQNQMAISVPKRYFKKAVDRNRLKRLTREAYRLNNKQILRKLPSSEGGKLSVLFVYVGKSIVGYNELESSLKKLLDSITIQINENEVS